MRARRSMLVPMWSVVVVGASGEELSSPSYSPTVTPACSPGQGRVNDECTLCAPGKYRDENSLSPACEDCPGGTVPSSGLCFLGTFASSTMTNNGYVKHHYQVEQFDGSCYYFGDQSVYWTSAERECNELSGHLVCLNGKTEAKRVGQECDARNTHGFWVGMSERGNERSFEWTNPNCCSDFRNWYQSKDSEGKQTREPTEDTEFSSFRCITSDVGAKLYDVNCRTRRKYVCEAPVMSGGSRCSRCRKGSYAPSGATECLPCDFGKYAKRNGMEECESCPTMSPASLLAKFFDQQGSVQCGGKLGRAQRNAYITACCLAAFGPLLLIHYVYFMQLSVGSNMAMRGTAAWPTASAVMRSKIASLAGTNVLFAGVIGGSLFANWLKPMRQKPEDWPYKGRLTPTDRIKGCDPANRYADFVCALICLLIVACSIVVSTPVPDVRVLARALHSKIATIRLRRQFKRQLSKWNDEQERRGQAFLDGVKASFACTLCGIHRADALNMPCGHQFMCGNCARIFRTENGSICNSCRRPSDLHKIGLRAKTTTVPTTSNDGETFSWFGKGGRTNRTTYSPRRGVRPKREEHPFFRSDAPSSRVEFELRALNTTEASVKDLRAAVAATKRIRSDARHQFLASTCEACGRATSLVVNIPCGHAVLCADCAADHRLTKGEVCSKCSAESSLQAPILELSCSCCFDVVNAEYLVTLGSCGHQLCTACSVGYIRSALSNVAEQVLANGIRCPLGGSTYADDAHQCSGFVTQDVVERLVTRKVRPEMADAVLPLKSEEFERLLRFMYEASLPLHVRFYCCWADCSRLFRVDNRDELVRKGAPTSADFRSLGRAPAVLRTRFRRVWRAPVASQRSAEATSTTTAHDSVDGRPDAVLEDSIEERGGEVETKDEEESFEGDAPFVTCPFCSRESCVRCKIPAHDMISCREVRSGGGGILETTALVEATSKACPQCNFRITHYHGHACHHIKPGTGCPNCGIHFCYRCLTRRPSGSPRCDCLLFCKNDDIKLNVKKMPYPHDRRCGCPLCPDCAPGRPCAQCSGGCVVCRGDVPPGPRDAADIEAWST